MRAIADAGYELIAVGSDSNDGRAIEDAGFEYHCYTLSRRSINPLSDLMSLLSLVRILKKIKPLAVHAFDTKPTIFGRIAAKLAGVRYIVATITGMGELFSDASVRNKLLQYVYIILQGIACRVSSATVFQNFDDLDFFVRRWMLKRSAAMVIHGSGIDVDRFDPDGCRREKAALFRRSLGIPDERMIVLMASRLLKHKGVAEYMKAARTISTRRSDIVFVLAGPMEEGSSAISRAEIDSYIDCVNYIGPTDDMVGMLCISDIFVLPTYYREGVPRVILEAMSMGVPVVSTDVPGCKDTVISGESGLIVPPRDEGALIAAIMMLIDDTELRRRMGLAARRRAIDMFSISAVQRETLKMYDGLIGGCTDESAFS